MFAKPHIMNLIIKLGLVMFVFIVKLNQIIIQVAKIVILLYAQNVQRIIPNLFDILIDNIDYIYKIIVLISKFRYKLISQQNMTLTLKQQLKFIVNSLAQKSLGFNNQSWFSLIDTKLIQNKQSKGFYYQIPIGKQIYQKFREEHFRYNDHGTTPQAITEELLVHYKQKRHVSMNVDEWGNIIAHIKSNLIQDYINQIVKEDKLTIFQCEEFLQFKQQNKEQNKENSFIFIDLRQNLKKSGNILNSKPNEDKQVYSLSDYRQVHFMNCCKNIIQKIKKSNPVSLDLGSKQLKHLLKNEKNTILSTCLTHQTISAQILLRKVTNSFSLYKFGCVYPQTKFEQSFLDKNDINKLKTIFLKTSFNKIINLQNYTQVQQKKIINKKIDNISELLINLQELLNEFNLTESYRILEQLEGKTNFTPVQTIIQSRMRQIFQIA